MKKILLVFILTGIISCKKKTEEKTEEPPPVVAAPARSNSMAAKVNGTSWAIKGNQTSEAKINVGLADGPPKQYVFIGQTTSSLYTNSIWLWTSYATGTVNLRSTPGFSAAYFDSTGTAFYVKSGTMTITAMDTSHVKSDKCDKFKATFSFLTDSTGGNGYTLDHGSIDFEAP